MSSPVSASLRRPRVYAIDFSRLLVITNVVVVHVLAQLPTTTLVGGIGIIIHVNREIFLMISAFVLSYSYGVRPRVDWKSFFRRRYMLILFPYVTWTILYDLLGGQLHANVGQDLMVLAGHLLNGRAWYHLYFMLILLQLYAWFPLLRWFMNRTKGHHATVLAAAAAYQLVFMALVQRAWGSWGPLGWWLGNPDAWLASYLFFIALGAVGAWHFDALIAFIDRHARRIMAAAALTAVAGVGVYLLQLHLGMSIEEASGTFQPMIVLESSVFALTVLALGRVWERRRAARRQWVMYGSVASFGVYLIHPLVIQLLDDTGLVVAGERLPEIIIVLLMLIIGVPLVMALSLLLTELASRTPLRLLLVGRPKASRARS